MSILANKKKKAFNILKDFLQSRILIYDFNGFRPRLV